MGVILQPVSDPVAQENLQKSVYNPVPLRELSPHLSREVVETLTVAYPNGLVYLWGTDIQEGNVVKHDWLSMEPGDLILMANKAGVQVIARILVTDRSEEISQSVWGSREFEFLYFLESVTELPEGVLTKAKVNERLLTKQDGRAYKSSFNWPGLLRIPAERSYLLLDALEHEFGDLVDLSSMDDPGQETVLTAVDAVINGTARLEQARLRKRLLGGRSESQCACCGRLLPRSLLVAGHIKKRSHCTHC